MRRVWVLLLLAPLIGCVVPQSRYLAEVTRGDVLKERVAKLDQRVRDLESSEETLTLERAALDQERIQLLDELEDMLPVSPSGACAT